MKTFVCYQVNDDYGNVNPEHSNLTFQETSQIVQLNSKPIQLKTPIILQKCNNWLYIFLNTQEIIALPTHQFNKVSNAMEKLKIGCVKVPNKETQLLAATGQFQNVYVHCGTFDYQHDCFVTVFFGNNASIQIRNELNNLLFTCELYQAKFNERIKAMCMGQHIFYFWKELGYEQIKQYIQENLEQLQQISKKTQMNDQKENLLSKLICQQQQMANQTQKYSLQNQSKEKEVSPLKHICQQKQMSILIEKQQFSIDSKEKHNQDKMLLQKSICQQQKMPNQMQKQQSVINSQEKQSKYQQWFEKTQTKSGQIPTEIQTPNKLTNDDKTCKKYWKKNDKQSEMQDENQNAQNEKEGENKQFIEQDEQIIPFLSVKLNVDDDNPSNKQHAQKKQSNIESTPNNESQQQMEQGNCNEMQQPQQSIVTNSTNQVCCLDKCNVIEIKQKNQKPFLYYHKFGDNGQTKEIANSRQILQLKQMGELDQQYPSNFSKLAFDDLSQTVYINDLNFNYIYSCNINYPQQQYYPTLLPVLDMTKQSEQNILGVHQNQIFLFGTRQCKKNVVLTYKTVNDMKMITSVYNSHCYATASKQGFVRTYDLRNHQKTMNKFKMLPGITSLQISQQGNYILCGYWNRAEILSSTDKQNSSIFERKIKIVLRKNVKTFIQDHELLTNIQFLEGSKTEGDVIALDNTTNGNVVMRNVVLSTSTINIPLKRQIGQVTYLSSSDQWLIYGIHGQYFRQQL